VVDAYTVDTVTVLRYAVGALPSPVRNLLGRAGTGQVELQVPAVVVSEAMYMAEANQSIKGHSLSMAASDVVDVVRNRMQGKVVDTTRDELQRIPELLSTWPSQMHDAMVVASHRARNTDGILTTDSKMNAHSPTVWD
jgi:predicted nucleic acid-binding protein